MVEPLLAEAVEVQEPEPASLPAPVTFTGTGGEYFRIWIVNVALTILTLGLYSAWAKVRRLQYFHRNTQLAGASFDYHGDPIVIFKGRLVGGALFMLYSMAGYVSPLLAVVVFVAIACIMPWMLARSLRFRLANTSHRGLRFHFTGEVGSAYRVFLGLPLLTLVTFGLLGPLCHHRIKRYQYDNTWFGNAAFRSTPSTQDFYVTYIFAGMIGAVVFGMLGAIVAGMVAASSAGAGGGEPVAGPSTAVALSVMVIGFSIYLLGILTIQAFLTARLRNVVWNHTTAGGHTFTSSLHTRPLLWILFSNLVATIGTVGLYWPYGQVRLTRYLAQGITMHGPLTFDHIEATSTDDEGAVGDEVAGFFDFDIAF
jgi:uncharacterized membrane protein YjgN (DUF898 family)